MEQKSRKRRKNVMCELTDEMFEEFKDGWGDTSPCMEYGDCDLCPYNSENEDINVRNI